jgi:hypothetical protein
MEVPMETVKVTIYEQITECFDCEVEIPDGLDDTHGEREAALAKAVEARRVDGDDERQFLTVDETWWDEAN